MQVLHRLGFDKSSVAKSLKAQTRVLLFNYWATYCILKARRPKFVVLQNPLPKADAGTSQMVGSASPTLLEKKPKPGSTSPPVPKLAIPVPQPAMA